MRAMSTWWLAVTGAAALWALGAEAACDSAQAWCSNSPASQQSGNNGPCKGQPGSQPCFSQLSKWQEESLLEAHNVYRMNHGACNLTYNPKIAQWSEKSPGFVSTCQNKKMKHNTVPIMNGNDQYGENLAMTSSTAVRESQDWDPASGVYNWYCGEEGCWDYSLSTSTGGTTGHMTQVVWNDTQEVGCALCHVTDTQESRVWNIIYLICNYMRPGNYGGRYADNVFKPGTLQAGCAAPVENPQISPDKPPGPNSTGLHGNNATHPDKPPGDNSTGPGNNATRPDKPPGDNSTGPHGNNATHPDKPPGDNSTGPHGNNATRPDKPSGNNSTGPHGNNATHPGKPPGGNSTGPHGNNATHPGRPSNLTIPEMVTIEGQSTCSMNYTAVVTGGTWVAKGNTLQNFSDYRNFTTVPWGKDYVFIRFDAPVPPFMRNLTYSLSFSAKIEGRVRLKQVQVLRFKKGQEKYYRADSIWPENYTEKYPTRVLEGRNLSMTAGSRNGTGWTEYGVSWVSPVGFAKPARSFWVYIKFSERPSKTPISLSVSSVCLKRKLEIRPPPRSLASYSEKFRIMLPPPPPKMEMEGKDCPWTGLDLVRWEDVVTGVPSFVILPENASVLVNASSFPAGARFDKIVVPTSTRLVFADAPIVLVVRALLVRGKLLIGSPTCRIRGPVKIVFWGRRTDPDSLGGLGTKGMAVTGEVGMFGKRFFPTWTRLARMGRAGDDRVYLQQRVNWYPGQEVLLTTTVWDDTNTVEPHQNEVMRIRAINRSKEGSVVQFTKPLKYTHYAGPEYQGEVALLSRQINMEGEPEPDGFGGHSVVAGRTAKAQFRGVASRFMGQTNVLARYPFHFHLLGHARDAVFSENVVRDSYFRCYTIHGTHDALVTENVAFNATGNCYYIEDGVEENNTVSYNLAAYVKPLGKPAAGGGQPGEVFEEDVNAGGLGSRERKQPADSAAAGFYFSNAHNTIVGNVASGGWSGFGFPGLPAPIGLHVNENLEPRSRPLKLFKGNVAHSSGAYWSSGACIYVGGQLEMKAGKLKYSSGRFKRNTRTEREKGFAAWEGTKVWMRFENTLVYACNKGLLHWGDRVEIERIEAHDISRVATLFGEAWLGNAIINGASRNRDAGFQDLHHDGFQFYDVSVKSIITNTEFRNFRKGPCRSIRLPGGSNWANDDVVCSADTNEGASISTHNNIIWSGLYHSDVFKPQQISAVKRIKYTNVDINSTISFKIAPNGASRFFNFIDHDGTATMQGFPTIVGSNEAWWNVCDDCQYRSEWEVWTCPKKPNNYPEREVAHIKVRTPDILWSNGGIGDSGDCQKDSGNGNWTLCDVGLVALWGHGPGHGDEIRSTRITSNAGITGITGTGWYMWLSRGAAKVLTIHPEQVPNGSVLKFATSYPAGTTFNVYGGHRWNKKIAKNFTMATSIDGVWADPHNKYYFDGNTFYMQLLLEESLKLSRFERDGAWVYGTTNVWMITIEASCATDASGFCVSKPTESVPKWTGVCPGPTTGVPPTEAPTVAPPSAAPRTSPPLTGTPLTLTPNSSAPVVPSTRAPPTRPPTTLVAGASRAPKTVAPSTSTPPSHAPRTGTQVSAVLEVRVAVVSVSLQVLRAQLQTIETRMAETLQAVAPVVCREVCTALLLAGDWVQQGCTSCTVPAGRGAAGQQVSSTRYEVLFDVPTAMQQQEAAASVDENKDYLVEAVLGAGTYYSSSVAPRTAAPPTAAPRTPAPPTRAPLTRSPRTPAPRQLLEVNFVLTGMSLAELRRNVTAIAVRVQETVQSDNKPVCASICIEVFRVSVWVRDSCVPCTDDEAAERRRGHVLEETTRYEVVFEVETEMDEGEAERQISSKAQVIIEETTGKGTLQSVGVRTVSTPVPEQQGKKGESGSSGMATAFLVSIIVGSVALAAAISVVVYCLFCRRRRLLKVGSRNAPDSVAPERLPDSVSPLSVPSPVFKKTCYDNPSPSAACRAPVSPVFSATSNASPYPGEAGEMAAMTDRSGQ